MSVIKYSQPEINRLMYKYSIMCYSTLRIIISIFLYVCNIKHWVCKYRSWCFIPPMYSTYCAQKGLPGCLSVILRSNVSYFFTSFTYFLLYKIVSVYYRLSFQSINTLHTPSLRLYVPNLDFLRVSLPFFGLIRRILILFTGRFIVNLTK